MEECNHSECESLEINTIALSECKKCGEILERQNFYMDETNNINFNNYIEDDVLPIQRTERIKTNRNSKYFKKQQLKNCVIHVINLLNIRTDDVVINRIVDIYLDLKKYFPNVKYKKALVAACIYQILGDNIYIPCSTVIKDYLQVRQRAVTSTHRLMKRYCAMKNIEFKYEKSSEEKFISNKGRVDNFIKKYAAEKLVDDNVLNYSLEFCSILNKIDEISHKSHQEIAQAILTYVNHIYKENSLKNLFSHAKNKNKAYTMHLYRINILIKSVLNLFSFEIPGEFLSKFQLCFNIFLKCLEYLKSIDSRLIRIILKNISTQSLKKMEMIKRYRKEYECEKSIYSDKTKEYETLKDVIIDLIHQGMTDENINNTDIELLQREKAVKRYQNMTEEEKNQEIDRYIKSFMEKEIYKKFINHEKQ